MLSTVSVILPAAIIVGAGFIVGKRVLDPKGIKALSDISPWRLAETTGCTVTK